MRFSTSNSRTMIENRSTGCHGHNTGSSLLGSLRPRRRRPQCLGRPPACVMVRACTRTPLKLHPTHLIRISLAHMRSPGVLHTFREQALDALLLEPLLAQPGSGGVSPAWAAARGLGLDYGGRRKTRTREKTNQQVCTQAASRAKH